MESSFFKIKLTVTETFYYDVIINNLSFLQSGGRCYEAFTEYIISNNIETIITVATIICLQIRYKVPLVEYEIKEIERIFELMNIIPVKKLLNENEYRYLQEDIKLIKQEYNKLLNKV